MNGSEVALKNFSSDKKAPILSTCIETIHVILYFVLKLYALDYLLYELINKVTIIAVIVACQLLYLMNWYAVKMILVRYLDYLITEVFFY